MNIVEEFTREAVASHIVRSIGARNVVRVLGNTFASRGTPAIIRPHNGRKFSAATVVDWLSDQNVTAAFIEKASPQQNCYVERFTGSMRDEIARRGDVPHRPGGAAPIGQWLEIHNHSRPHWGLGMMTPAAFAAGK